MCGSDSGCSEVRDGPEEEQKLPVRHSHKMISKGENRGLTFVFLSNLVRFLEHFILNGPDPNALDAVLAQLNDPKRPNPQELDRAVIGKACVFKAFHFESQRNNLILQHDGC